MIYLIQYSLFHGSNHADWDVAEFESEIKFRNYSMKLYGFWEQYIARLLELLELDTLDCIFASARSMAIDVL